MADEKKTETDTEPKNEDEGNETSETEAAVDDLEKTMKEVIEIGKKEIPLDNKKEEDKKKPAEDKDTGKDKGKKKDEGKKGDDDTPAAKEGADKEHVEEVDTDVKTETAYFGPQVLARAKKHGVSITEARGFGNSDDLKLYLEALDEEKVGAGDDKKPETKKPEGFKVELDPDEVDSTIIDQLNKMNEYHQKKYDEQEKRLAELTGKSDERTKVAENAEILRKSEEFDKWVGNLGDDAPKEFGKGYVGDKPNSPEFKNRAHVFMLTDFLKGFYKMSKREMPPVDEIRKQALTMLFGNENIKKKAKEEIANKVKKRAGQITSRPSGHSKESSVSPDSKMVENVQSFLDESGLNK